MVWESQCCVWFLDAAFFPHQADNFTPVWSLSFRFNVSANTMHRADALELIINFYFVHTLYEISATFAKI